MEKTVLLKMKNELEEIKNKDIIELEKKRNKERKLKAKKDSKEEFGARKVYYIIWQQILKNIKKEFFRVLIHVKCSEDGDVVVWKITIDKNIKKIIAIPTDIYMLLNLLNMDGLYTSVSRYSKKMGSDIILTIEVSRHCLENIISKSEESSNIRIKEM